MPRTPKKDEVFPVDEEAVAAAIAEAQEDLVAEEAAAAFFAAQAKSGEGEDGEATVDEIEAEPVLGEPSGLSDDESGYSAREEAEDDEGSAGEEPEGPSESEPEAEETAVAPEVDTRTSAEKRPRYDGLTIVTD